jgi:hypothetical protein
MKLNLPKTPKVMTMGIILPTAGMFSKMSEIEII